MKSSKAVIFLFFIPFLAFSQVPMALLSDTIKANADAVVQSESYTVTIESQEKQVINHKATITVLNEAGNHFANLFLFYDKETKISSVKLNYYNVFGKLIEKVKRKDFNDYSATGNSNLYTDNRVLHYTFLPKNYPYTVVYEYEIVSKNTAFIHPWQPLTGYYISVIKSNYSIQVANDLTLNKLESNFKGFNINKTTVNGRLKYTISDLKAFKKEPLSPSFNKIAPTVRFAVDKFRLAGVKGKANNWNDFGKWMYQELLASRNNLSQETKDKIKALVANEKDPVARARIIYDYVQNKTRYISIQIGIGGWMPMLTNEVDKLGYGDCKALTYYTKSLLDVAEVPSYYTILYAGDSKRDIAKELVAIQGNHAFLCVPTAKDTIWLECTSQKVPFGYINSFSDDRDVFVVTENGGQIKHTSKNKSKENLQHSIINYSVSNLGELKGNAKISSYGTQYKTHLNVFNNKNPKDLKIALKEFYALNEIDFNEIRVTNNKKKKRYDESFEFNASGFAKQYTTSILVFNLNPFNRISYIPQKVRKRKLPFEIVRGYKDIDEYSISLPENYSIDNLPKDETITSKYGTYTRVLKQDGKKLVFKRQFTLNSGTYPQEDYEDYRVFRKKINKLENIKIMLNKQS
jgi:hypothetical protein